MVREEFKQVKKYYYCFIWKKEIVWASHLQIEMKIEFEQYIVYTNAWKKSDWWSILQNNYVVSIKN